MKNNRIIIILLFIIFALPIPLSLLSWIGTIISVSDMGMIKRTEFIEYIQMIMALTTMLLAGTYLITYMISLRFTLKNKKISHITFLPMVHIVLFSILFYVSSWVSTIYKS